MPREQKGGLVTGTWRDKVSHDHAGLRAELLPLPELPKYNQHRVYLRATNTRRALIREITHHIDSYSMDNVRSVILKENEEGMIRGWRGWIEGGEVGAQVKSSGTTVPTVPCFHGRHWNCTVGTGIARKCHREVTAAQ